MKDESRRIQVRTLTVLLFVLGLAFVGIAVYYVVTPASALPSIFPGHQAGSSHHHVKHAIAAGAIALVAWIVAWFTTAPSKTPSKAQAS